MLQLTYLEYWRYLPPAGKLLVLYAGTMLLVAAVKAIACSISVNRGWNNVGRWLQQAAVSVMMGSFVYACYIGQLIALGNRHFSDERASGYLVLMKELFFHFRVLSAIALIFFCLYLVGWNIRSRAERTPSGV